MGQELKFMEAEPESNSRRSHPIVQGAGNIIQLEVRSGNDYFGPLYIGSEYREQRVFYDTASSWVSVTNVNTDHASLLSNYDVSESTKANPIYLDSATKKKTEKNIDYGSFFLSGYEYTDNICLQQNKLERRDDTGRMCVRNMPFLSVESINGEFSGMGVVGLAPSNTESSYVWHLFNQGQIP